MNKNFYLSFTLRKISAYLVEELWRYSTFPNSVYFPDTHYACWPFQLEINVYLTLKRLPGFRRDLSRYTFSFLLYKSRFKCDFLDMLQADLIEYASKIIGSKYAVI